MPDRPASFLDHVLEFLFKCEGSFPSLRILKVIDFFSYRYKHNVEMMLSSKLGNPYRASARPNLKIVIVRI